MARPTETERRKARVEDRDPAAPLFDAIDRMHRRLDAVLSNLRRAASTAAQEVIVPELRRELIRGIFAMSALVAVATTAIAVSICITALRAGDARALAWAQAVDEERSRSFAARVEQRAAELASSRIAEADLRAAKAEAEATNARASVLALAGKGGDEDVRALLSALVTAPRGDLHVIWRILRHPDQNVRRLALQATEIQSGDVSRILQQLEKVRR